MTWLRQKYWHELFEAGVFLKAFNSVWELFGAVFILFTPRTYFTQLIVSLSNSELLGDRDDIFSNYIHDQLMHLAVSTRTFVGFYLLFHGIINMFLAYNLYRNRLWAYPLSIGFVSLFLVYQIYRLSHTHSTLLLAITVFDFFFIILTWHEYRYQLSKHHALPSS